MSLLEILLSLSVSQQERESLPPFSFSSLPFLLLLFLIPLSGLFFVFFSLPLFFPFRSFSFSSLYSSPSPSMLSPSPSHFIYITKKYFGVRRCAFRYGASQNIIWGRVSFSKMWTFWGCAHTPVCAIRRCGQTMKLLVRSIYIHVANDCVTLMVELLVMDRLAP